MECLLYVTDIEIFLVFCWKLLPVIHISRPAQHLACELAEGERDARSGVVLSTVFGTEGFCW